MTGTENNPSLSGDLPDANGDLLFMLQVTHTTGWTLTTGPFDLPTTIVTIDAHVTGQGWTPQVIQITPWERALGHLTGGGRHQPQPDPDADLFVAIRRAVFTHPTHGGADPDGGANNPAAQLVVAAVEKHRRVTLYSGDEDCVSGECGHTDTTTGCDLGPQLHLCAGCSIVYDDGSEWSPHWLEAGRILWPCDPLRKITAFYGVLLPQVTR